MVNQENPGSEPGLKERQEDPPFDSHLIKGGYGEAEGGQESRRLAPLCISPRRWESRTAAAWDGWGSILAPAGEPVLNLFQ